MTLTTDIENIPYHKFNSMLKVKNNVSVDKAHTVESQLVQNWRKLMKSECSMSLMTSLLRKNISTRDIYFFAKNQAKLRKVYKDLDRPLSKAAMRA